MSFATYQVGHVRYVTYRDHPIVTAFIMEGEKRKALNDLHCTTKYFK